MSFLDKLIARKKKARPSSSSGLDGTEAKHDSDVSHSPKVASPSTDYQQPAREDISHAVEVQSIFMGLNLSAQVASNEEESSPYLKRSTG